MNTCKSVGYFVRKMCNYPVKLQKLENVCKYWIDQFRFKDILEPVESAENIIAHVINSDKLIDVQRNSQLILKEEQIHCINNLCTLRLNRMPVQYIIGEWQFRSLKLKLRPPVFIPRPETEELVELALKVLQDIRKYGIQQKINVLDLCCGSGAIGLSLLHENYDIKLIAVDRSQDACELTKENAEHLHLNNRIDVVQQELSLSLSNEQNLLIDINDMFDLIVCNPPYVPTHDVQNVQDEIKLYEDVRALDGGPGNGTDTIELVLRAASMKLRGSGRLLLEVDPRQPIWIAQYLHNNTTSLGLKYVNTYKDFCKKDRFVEIIKM